MIMQKNTNGSKNEKLLTIEIPGETLAKGGRQNIYISIENSIKCILGEKGDPLFTVQTITILENKNKN